MKDRELQHDIRDDVEGVKLVPSTHESLRDVVDPKTLRDLYVRSDLDSLFRILASVATYFGLGLFAAEVSLIPVWIVVWFFQGLLLACLLGAAHDCAHSTMFSNATVNRHFGAVFAAIGLFNFSLYKWFHLIHHKHTTVSGDTEPGGEFPDLRTYIRALPTDAFFGAFWRMSFMATKGIFPDFVPSKKARRDVQFDNILQFLWILLVLLLLVFFPSQTAFLYLVPVLFYFPMVSLTSLPEHYDCERGSNIWTNTRSITSNPIFRYFFWNGNFHAAHHIAPGVPSRNLPKLHALIADRLANVDGSYFVFHLNLVRTLISSNRSEVEKEVDPSFRIDFEYEMYRSEED